MKVTVKELADILNLDDSVCLIDVRSPGEFKSVCIKGAQNIPSDKVDDMADILNKDDTIYMMCHAGNRSKTACKTLREKGFTNIVEVEGGIDAWLRASLPVEKSESGPISMMRQVMIVAGVMILIGTIGNLAVHSNFIYMAMFVGAGLTFAGVSGNCYMTRVLGLMPWNK